MNSNLRKAVLKDKRKIRDIMPLSEIDAKIMEEIMIALRNMEQDLLLIILDKYKEVSDEQIFKVLQQFNIDYDPANYREEEIPKFIDIKGAILQISNIMSIERDQQWNLSTVGMQYRIIINKSASDNLFLSNKIIFFDSLQQREYEIGKIKKKLEIYNIKIV